MKHEDFIHLCSKGFFIVEFDMQEDHDLGFNLGMWFWGNSGLCMKPWSPSFNPTTYILYSAWVWVRLSNLPLHFLGLLSLENIGLALGKFHFASRETTRHDTSTYARVCMEMDFSKGFWAEVILTGKNYSGTHKIDYERVSLGCISCFQTCHIASHYPKGSRKIRKHKKSTWWVGSNDDHQFISKDCKEPPEENENPSQTDPPIQHTLLFQVSCHNSTLKAKKEAYALWVIKSPSFYEKNDNNILIKISICHLNLSKENNNHSNQPSKLISIDNHKCNLKIHNYHFLKLNSSNTN